MEEPSVEDEWWLANLLSRGIDPSEYLIERKFPAYSKFRDESQQSEEIVRYKEELRQLRLGEIRTLYEAESDRDHKQQEKRDALEERNRFFNHPNARADFCHWAKSSYWSLDEAVALSLGRDPALVKWETIGNLYTSPFAKQYGKRRELVLRAHESNQLDMKPMPGVFLAWARRMSLSVPDELVAAVEAQGIQIADWKTKFDKLNEDFAILEEQRNSLVAEVNEITAERNQLRIRIAELESQAWEGFDEKSDTYPEQLDIAMQAWRAAVNASDDSMTPKQYVVSWLDQHYPKLPSEAKQRIATICNWEKLGGRPRRGE